MTIIQESAQKTGSRRQKASKALTTFLISNWGVITGLTGGGFAFYKFVLDRSVPANIQLSLDASVAAPIEKGKPALSGTEYQSESSNMIPLTFTLKASNDSHFRDLKIHNNLWFAYGWKYSTQGSTVKPGSSRIYDLHRQAEYLYGDPSLYEKHLKKSDQLSESEKSSYIQEIEDWLRKNKLPPGRIDDATKRRLAGYTYYRDLVGVGNAFSPSELKPGQQIEARHVIPISRDYDVVEIRVLLPTSEPGRRQDWFGLVGKTDTSLKVELLTFSYVDRTKRINPVLIPRMCGDSKCVPLSESQMKNLRYQSQTITSQLWIPK